MFILQSPEQDKETTFFLKPFHVFQSLLELLIFIFIKIFKRSATSKELSFTQFEILFKNLIEGTKIILEIFTQFCNNLEKYFHSTLYAAETAAEFQHN